MNRASCVLGTLDNPLLNNLSLGLSCAEDGLPRIQTEIFPCCAGQGTAWDDHLCGIRTCPLQARLARVQKFYALYKRTWPEATRKPHQLPPGFSTVILQEIAGVLKHDRAPAQIAYMAQKNQPSLAWSKALGVIWRFGVEARVINLSRLKPRDLVRELSEFTRDHDGPLALFVEHIDKLWDPLFAEAVEHIVQRAYNADAFLWLEFMQKQQPEPDVEGEEGSSWVEINRKIQSRRKDKNRHPLDELTSDCISRLQSMSGQFLKTPGAAE